MQNLNQVSLTLYARGGKKVFDAVTATVLLILFSPFLLIIAALIKLTSPGPVYFRQDRGGLHGCAFRLIKFRTMHGDRKPDPKEIVPLDHPEITPLGRILRRTKLDELPQLFNVLRGDMSVVGPRPTLLDQIAAYDDFRRQRLLARPGITGLAQVYGNALATWDERILYDIAYVRRCSFALDLLILLRTPLVILLGEQFTTRPFAQSRFRKYVQPPPGYADPQPRP
jgi:lipopolysaccharide/colanic/teichoic acid biosynthesis glycosyltransferase